MSDQLPATPHAFADLFAQIDEAQWRARVDAVLKGAPFARLESRSYDDIRISPLYLRLTGERPRALRATGGRWAMLARIDHPDAGAANSQALADLANGADGLHLVFNGSIGACGFGLPGGREALARVLDGVVLESGLPIELDLSADTKDSAPALADLFAERGADPAATSISFGFDPLGQMALGGGAPMDWAGFAPFAAKTMASLAARGFRGRVAVADGRPVHAAGGSEGQELAFVIAAALAYLRALEGVGIDLAAARAMIGLRVACDADEIMGIAKLRALRRLWARIEEACGLTPVPVHIHAETSFRMMSRRDPWVNILRASVAAFAAGLGGADAVSVLPFTQALGLPDDFARRIARNSQSILLDESNLGRVADPAAGAGAFEALTDALCEAAWGQFQEIERDGGLYNSLASGRLQTGVAGVQAARARNIARRKDALTGTSEFPNVAEAPVAVLAPMPDAPPAATPAITFAALAPHRDAEAFEALRDRADAHAASTGTRQSVFLANLGPIAAFSARTTFAKNLFEAGGIAAPGNEGFLDDDSLVAAFRASGASIACLCSSDALYEARAAAAARALSGAGARRIYLAGRPGAAEAQLREAGVTGFAFAGCDVVALLEEALAIG